MFVQQPPYITFQMATFFIVMAEKTSKFSDFVYFKKWRKVTSFVLYV
jgi:hypothetical protein